MPIIKHNHVQSTFKLIQLSSIDQQRFEIWGVKIDWWVEIDW